MRSTNIAKITANATICSTFEVQYGIPTTTRTTAIRHFRATLTDHVIRACAQTHLRLLTQHCAGESDVYYHNATIKKMRIVNATAILSPVIM